MRFSNLLKHVKPFLANIARSPGVDTPQARGFFSKIWLWALPFHKVIYIDTDILTLGCHSPRLFGTLHSRRILAMFAGCWSAIYFSWAAYEIGSCVLPIQKKRRQGSYATWTTFSRTMGILSWRPQQILSHIWMARWFLRQAGAARVSEMSRAGFTPKI